MSRPQCGRGWLLRRKIISILDLKLATLGAFWALFLQLISYSRPDGRLAKRRGGRHGPSRPLNPPLIGTGYAVIVLLNHCAEQATLKLVLAIVLVHGKQSSMLVGLLGSFL